MITAVVDNGNGILYYDGVEVGTIEEGTVLPSVTADDRSFYLGVNAWDKPFAGLIDELYIYDRSLTADDVKELYEATKTVAEQETLQVAVKEWDKPQLANPDEFLQSSDDGKSSEKSDDNTMMYIIIAVVVVAVVVVIVAVVMSSKKKNADNDNEDDDDEE